MHAYLMRARMEFRSRVFSSVLPYVSTNFRKNTEESVRLAALIVLKSLKARDNENQ